MRPDRRKRLFGFAFLGGGLALALYLGTKAPREQHVRLVLGARAPEITAVDVRYVTDDGEEARAARFTFAEGAAPRILGHDPDLADGDYLVQVSLDARTGRRSLERRVTLGGGSTQVDLEADSTPRTAP